MPNNEDSTAGEYTWSVTIEERGEPTLDLIAPDARTAKYAFGRLQSLMGRTAISLEAAASEVEMELDAEGVEVTLRIQR